MIFRCSPILLFFFVATTSAQSPDLSSNVENPLSLRRFYGLSNKYLENDQLKEVKIAIFAKGFAGVTPDNRDARYLPRSVETRFDYGDPDALPLDSIDQTGRRLAQIVWAMVGYGEERTPKIRLYNANGLENFQHAVEDAEKWPADIILSNINFEGMGNFDGTGFVNKLVEEAARNEILWVQSVGEYNKKVFNGPVDLSGQAWWGQLKAKAVGFVGVPFLKFKINSDKTDTTISLSWNAYSPGRRFRGTDKDLDLLLYLTDPTKNAKAVPYRISNFRQVVGTPKSEGHETQLAFEQIKVVLGARTEPYYVVVKQHGGSFDSRVDKLRVTITSSKKPFRDKDGKVVDPLEFVDAFNGGSGSVMVPSDNPMVFTIGSTDDRSSSDNTLGRQIPVLKLDGDQVYFSDGRVMSGPDAAAAEFAGMLALWKGWLRANKMELLQKHVPLLIQKSQMKESEWSKKTNEEKIKAYQKEGYTFGGEDSLLRLIDKDRYPNILEKLQGWVAAAGREKSGDPVYVGLVRNPVDLPIFSYVSDEIKHQPDDHLFYLYPRKEDGKLKLGWYDKLAEAKGGPPSPWKQYDVPAKDFLILKELDIGAPQRRLLDGRSTRWKTLQPEKVSDLVKEDP
jgi:hypothetical protein